jgi:septal ring factor EnvC (AmiA/AmiB activator)
MARVFNMYKTLFILCILLSSLTSQCAYAASSKAEELQKITQQIESTKSQLTEAQKKAQGLADALKKSEIEIGNTSKNIVQLTEQIKPKQKELSTLQTKAITLQRNLESQQTALAILLRTAYQNRQSTYLKLLLNEEHPSQFSRMNQYYQYYSLAEIQLMQSIQATLSELKSTQKKINSQVTTLSQLKNKQIIGQKELQKSQEERKVVMTKIQSDIKTTQQKLSQLIENKKNLENLVSRLSRQEFINDTNFERLKNRLTWPVQGSLTRRFGYKQSVQSLPEQGVFIKAKADQDIRVIAPGKVIYAEWLKGFGLLMIVDHGKGYMSLYSHCNTLKNKVGDIVKAGETIASVGNSGGFQESGLAFEIRHNGKPLDPHHWCKGNP